MKNLRKLIGLALALVMALGMMMPAGRTPMKTQVGKRIQKVGVAVDHTVDNLISNLR